MIVEKCKRVMMEERHGRRRARRMAREVAGLVGNPLGAATGFAGNAVNSIAGEDMGGGAKVLLLLLGAAAVGGGIYYFTTKPAAATPIPTPVTNPVNTTATAPTGTIAVPAATSSPPAGTSVATMVSRAVVLANLAQSTGHSGDLPPAIQWASWAVASGANASQLAQLRGAGFIV
jgi:hypothetical protein